ncbi:MAG: LysE family translocator [Acinetobacter populi]|jgi:threonine/homoserine/homoserine lactone efflux protein|uniref:LysE family translocator n=1 Tax=Acinetobacter populi TaxID=1582270 RepID=UPI002357EDA5|nr:LysE family transporter [Acinetobacter populi]MCH4246460.1 LysE family translocator [Acinetobacter populi]
MNTFLLIATTHFLALLSPGPDFFLILRTSLTRSRICCFYLCLGIALGNAIYIALVFTGFKQFAQYPQLFSFIQFLGGCYLLYLSFSIFKASTQHVIAERQHIDLQRQRNIFQYFLMGLLSSLLNPKNALFYASLISLLGPNIRLPTQLFYALWMIAMVLSWDLLIAWLFQRPQVLEKFNRYLSIIEKITATLFFCFAAILFGLLFKQYCI